MAYSPSIKILDHLNLVSSQSIYFWSRPMHFQLMSPGPTIDMRCDGEEVKPSFIHLQQWLATRRQTDNVFRDQSSGTQRGQNESREALEMGKGWPEGQAGLGSGPIFVPSLFCDLVIPSHSNHARPPESHWQARGYKRWCLGSSFHLWNPMILNKSGLFLEVAPTRYLLVTNVQ